MRRFSCSFITTGLGLACVVLAAPAAAAEGHPVRDGTQIAAATQVAEASATPPRRTPGMTEIPDPELATMRGRYTVGDHQVAWFGVSMISTWQTASGQTLQGTLSLGMDFAGTGRPAPRGRAARAACRAVLAMRRRAQALKAVVPRSCCRCRGRALSSNGSAMAASASRSSSPATTSTSTTGWKSIWSATRWPPTHSWRRTSPRPST